MAPPASVSSSGQQTPSSDAPETPLRPSRTMKVSQLKQASLAEVGGKLASKMPKIVVKAREAMEAAGSDLEVTGDNLKKVMEAKDFNLLANAFRGSMSGAAKKQYSACVRTDQDRRQWLAQFVIDPRFATAEGFNVTEAFHINEDIDEERWATEEKLAGPTFYNCAKHAAVMTKSGELEERPHRNQALADAGVKEYKYTGDIVVRKKTGSHERNGVSLKTELNDQEYKDVVAKVGDGVQKGGVKRKLVEKKPRVEESQESKDLKRAQNLRSGTLRRCKTLLDKAALDASSLQDSYQKLADRGYPSAMREFYDKQVVVFQEQIKIHQKAFADEATQVETAPTAETVGAGNIRIEQIMKTLEAKHKIFKEKVVQDIRKLTA